MAPVLLAGNLDASKSLWTDDFMLRKIRALLSAIRPMQAYKAGIVWLPALFHGHGSLRLHAKTLALATLAWWLTSSVVYVLNDLKDAPKDRLRPERAHRPIASREVRTWEALGLAAVALGGLLIVLWHLPAHLALLVGLYGVLNFLYTLGLKESLGVRQAVIAIGFWLRLQSGAAPVVAIPLTPWASLFTLGLAYFLNCLKGLVAYAEDHHRGYRFAMGMGAGLAGSLALASLVAICLKRGVDGTMRFPELPPLLCLLGMHRTALASFRKDLHREQAHGFFFDPVTVATMLAFVVLFLY